MTDLRTVRIVLTLAVEDDADLQDILEQIEDLAGAHPAVLTIETEENPR